MLKNYVKICDRCQRYVPSPRVPSETLNPVTSPWSFAQWGMDIVGPLPIAAVQNKFMLVATNYFSKWVKVEAYANIKDIGHLQVCLEKHRVSVWSPTSDCGRQ